jgi:hypothetical protein
VLTAVGLLGSNSAPTHVVLEVAKSLIKAPAHQCQVRLILYKCGLLTASSGNRSGEEGWYRTWGKR